MLNIIAVLKKFQPNFQLSTLLQITISTIYSICNIKLSYEASKLCVPFQYNTDTVAQFQMHLTHKPVTTFSKITSFRNTQSVTL